MKIRDYQLSDEQAWLRCRVVAFMDSSYYQDVQQHRETFAQPTIELIAVDQGKIVGLIDVEIDTKYMTHQEERGAMVWSLAVLPEYRRQGLAKQLWQTAKERLLSVNVHYCELWTQEDIPANLFYQYSGFEQDDSATYLRCTIAGRELPLGLSERVTQKALVEDMTFEAQLSARAKMAPLCAEIIETRMYTQHF